MTLKVIGAGLGRTGTTSLLIALEMLLDKPCYHMSRVFQNPGHIEIWRQASLGKLPDWQRFYQDYAATVDWPSAAFVPELKKIFPEALVILSSRDPEAWWASASETIFCVEDIPGADVEKQSMIESLFSHKFTPDYRQKDKAIAAYEAHNRRMVEEIPSTNLLSWEPDEGWGPLCSALKVDMPEIPFPKANTREQWRERARQTGI